MAEMGRPPYKPNDEDRRIVRLLSRYGAPQEDIATQLHLCVETMQKYYADDIAEARAEADGEIRQSLYKRAVQDGNTALLIFLCKTRLRMSEKITLVDERESREVAPEQRASDAVQALRAIREKRRDGGQ